MRGSTNLAKEALPAPPGYLHPPVPPAPASPWLAGDHPSMPGNGTWPPPGSPWPPVREAAYDPWLEDWFKDPPAAAPDPPRGPGPARARARVGWPWWLLWPWTAVWVAWQLALKMTGQSWHFFAQGGQLLFGTGMGTGLQLYAAHPGLQIGPLALAASGVLRLTGPGQGEIAAVALMSATGPVVLWAVWRLLPPAERGKHSRLFLAGLFFLPVWTELTTHFAHLDDLLALCFSVAALHAVARRNPVWAGLALAAATDAKPWAAAFVALIFALPRRQWLAALSAFTGGVAAAWLPFLAADPHTLTAARFSIPNDPSSALRVLGVMSPRTPWWDRSAQLALGAAAGLLAVRRGRWPAVLLVAVAARILLDPGVYGYYTSGAVLGTIVVDLVLSRWRFPWATAAAATLLYAARMTHQLVPFDLHQLGVLRLIFAIGVPVLVLGVPGWWITRRRGRHARAGDQVTIISPAQARHRDRNGSLQLNSDNEHITWHCGRAGNPAHRE